MDLTVLLTHWGAAFWLPAALAAVLSYVCGCFNGAVIVSKFILRDDVRTHGSGNAGLTNFYRTYGGPLTLLVILCDVLKAVCAVLGTGLIFRSFIMNDGAVLILSKYWAGLWCLLGHMFPCMFGFKGGKGVLSGGTVAVLIDWRLALLVFGGFFLIVILTRYVSLGSVCAAAGFPVGTWLFVSRQAVIMVLAIGLGALVIYMHRGNIARLVRGEERKLSLHKKKA